MLHCMLEHLFSLHADITCCAGCGRSTIHIQAVIKSPVRTQFCGNDTAITLHPIRGFRPQHHGTGTVALYRLIDTGAGATTPSTGTEISLSATTTDAQVDDMIRVVDSIFSQMTDSASNLGAINKRVAMQEDFVANLMDSVDKGIGRLVDADMNEESTRLQALQVKQQLGLQALSIANSSSQSILALFQ